MLRATAIFIRVCSSQTDFRSSCQAETGLLQSAVSCSAEEFFRLPFAYVVCGIITQLLQRAILEFQLFEVYVGHVFMINGQRKRRHVY